MDKEIRIYDLHDPQQYEDEKAYWKSKTPEERLQAAEFLRKQFHKLKGYEPEPKLQRVYRITKENEVEYLIVGGYAVILHGYPRYTGDMDFLLNRAPRTREK